MMIFFKKIIVCSSLLFVVSICLAAADDRASALPLSAVSFVKHVFENDRFFTKEYKIEARIAPASIGSIEYNLDANKRAYISILVVDSKHRGNKIGTTLLNSALFDLSQTECCKVCLTADPFASSLEDRESDIRRLYRFYERFGFQADKELGGNHMVAYSPFVLSGFVAPFCDK